MGPHIRYPEEIQSIKFWTRFIQFDGLFDVR